MKPSGRALRALLVFHLCLGTGTSPELSPAGGGQMSWEDTPTFVCPAPCTCSKSGTSVNCEGKRLTSVPKGIPPMVETLYLDHNNFVVLGENSFFNLTHLNKVSLRNSQIQTLQAGAFRNLPLLKELYLTNNRIATLSPLAFEDVGTLSLLNLQANTMTSVPDLPSLPGLKKLYLEANQIQNATFPPGYAKLKALNAIVLSNNAITRLTNQTFAVLSGSGVRRLEIARNGLKEVSAGALRPLKMLQSLKIGWNPLDGQQLQHVLEGLRQDSNLESLDIRSIHLGGALPSFSFSILSATPLRTLIFNHNTVRKIPQRAFAHLPKLVVLDLSTCQVQEVADDAFMDLPGLQTLFLNDNQDLASVPKNLPGNLQRLYLQGSGIARLQDGDFQNLARLQELYLSNNKIHEVAENSLVGLMSLRDLHLQGNVLSYIPKKLFAPLTGLQTLSLKNNNLRTLKPNPGAMSSLADLTVLDMSGNQCNFIPFDFLASLAQLQILYLDDNDLDGLMAADGEGRLLGQLRKLQRLGLSNNNLRYIHDAQFRNLYELQYLNLRNNQLSSWGPDLFYTPGTAKKSLKTLDLSGNRIALVNETSVRDLQHLRVLNLTSNPFACTCDLRWFRTWLNDTSVNVVNQTLYKCNSPAAWNGRPLLEFGPDKIDCTDYTWYYVGIAIAVTFVLAVIVLSVVYHRRWFIRLKLHRLKEALRGGSKGGMVGGAGREGYEALEGEDHQGQRFDFYVLNADQDNAWVTDNLLPVLDNRMARDDLEHRPGGFALYFEPRDGDASRTDVANFDHFIERCRAVLVVLTSSLREDRRCTSFLEVAYDMLHRGDIEDVQIIKVGPIPPRLIPGCLRRAVQSNRYREWLTRDNVEQEFVNFLQDNLRRDGARHYGAAGDPPV